MVLNTNTKEKLLKIKKILEMGTHDELIEKQGRYYELYMGNLNWIKSINI
ncbi:hypothetical protein [Parvimonas parva]|uniref:Uncharacterized protein n=1 Tax=Parvimonas parva TaxID=2769485 RepID=A0ABS1C9R3_9FIRM|nr:hypothetical protein [Parvimonas parva]MBK1468678.1 hypothetical protein [Parvimonas parva]